MYGRYLRSSNPTSLNTMITRPPRPPCWRDFMQPPSDTPRRSGPRRHKGVPQSLSFSDLSSAHHRTKSEGGSSKPAPHKKQQPQQHGGGKGVKLHRTRSQLALEQEHLPEPEHMMRCLADTKPRELLRKPATFDSRIYLDDNIRRCERWLAGVRASEPLDDIVFSQGAAGIGVVLPEESWADLENAKNVHNNSSASESDIDSVSACCGSNVIDSESNNKRRSHRIHDARKPKKMESQGQSARGNWLLKAKNMSENTVEMEPVPEQTSAPACAKSQAVQGSDGRPPEWQGGDMDIGGGNLTKVPGVPPPPPPSRGAHPAPGDATAPRHMNGEPGGGGGRAGSPDRMDILVEEPGDVTRPNLSILSSTVPICSVHGEDGDPEGGPLAQHVPGYVESESDWEWKTCHATVDDSET